MSGVVFIVCIPTEKYEKYLIKEQGKQTKFLRVENEKNFTPKKKNNYGSISDSTCSLDRCVPNGDPCMCKEAQTMETILTSILQSLSVNNSTWLKRDEDNYLQVIFSIDCGDKCDEILEILKKNQIGQLYNSTVSVVPCSIQYNAQQECTFLDGENFNEESHGHDKNNAWHRFLNSVRAKLTVAQVVENIKSHATFTFDFLFLILISTTMCAIGLVENSNVYLLSSMVICPMMGPVMAGTFGSVIEHRRLLKIGIQNELLGLGIATIVGFCYGGVISAFTDKYGSQTWPTYEMLSRGELRSLWVGSLIALLSGAVVALGILSDNIASLVGVAISTSLTPPAVNAGLFWSLGMVYYFKGVDENMKCPNLTLNYYYSNKCFDELLSLGAVSICLTFSNIICIYAAGILVFKMKEVAPMSSKDNARRRFWKHDIKIARNYIKTVQREDTGCMISKLSEDIAQYQRKRNSEQLCHSTDVSSEHSKIDIMRPEYTWSPCMYFKRNADINELNDLYQSLLKTARERAKATRRDSHSYPRLSQVFVPDEELNPISEGSSEKVNGLSDLSTDSGNSSTSKQCNRGKTKFTVTPCKFEEEPLLGKIS